MIYEIPNWRENTNQDIINKINELITKINELESMIKSQPPKRYFRNDFGHIYEVDEFGNLIFNPVPRGD